MVAGELVLSVVRVNVKTFNRYYFFVRITLVFCVDYSFFCVDYSKRQGGLIARGSGSVVGVAGLQQQWLELETESRYSLSTCIV